MRQIRETLNPLRKGFLLGKKLRVVPPAGWHEVSFLTALELIKRKDAGDVEILSIITGLPMQHIRESTNIETVSYFLSMLGFLNELPNAEYPELPKKVNINDTVYYFPFVVYKDKYDLGNANVGQVEDMKAILQGCADEIEMIAAYPKLMAIYLQGQRGYDYTKALELAKKCEELDFKTVFNVGNFFLTRLLDLKNGGQKERQMRNIASKRFKRAYWIFQQRLVSMLPSITSLVIWGYLIMKHLNYLITIFTQRFSTFRKLVGTKRDSGK